MAKLWGWIASFLLHAAPAALVVCLGLGVRVQAPIISVSTPPSTPLTVDLESSQDTPEFVTAREAPSRLELEDVPVEFEPDRESTDSSDFTEAIARMPDRPAPSFDRLVATVVGAQKVSVAESVPQVETETVAREVYNPPPEYPLSARRRKLEGNVLIEVLILADGTCGEAKVVEDCEHHEFGQAALDSVRKWKYHPATRAGQPVSSAQRIRFVFKLQG